jgi:hypothetical protein
MDIWRIKKFPIESTSPHITDFFKVGYKEVKNTTSLGMSKVVIKHVLAYSEAIFGFYNC